ncbi:hypothetical protein PAHAL_5G183800 [Panicum hallii]|uniref:protein-serine/threonine phosphatase n=1 Tax=Panicum hallii TaxID=206008 RepID=A0A2S3HSB9_9POAL|nr:protein phosphatase 2C 50-like [Panicum hallii]PAN28881.1 hypothetical protein PAHAL_5G183800 [Panicum hallii]
MATPGVLDNGAARAAGGSEADGGARPASRSGGKRRSAYLVEYAPAWGSAATRGRRAAMEDASAAVPRFAGVPVRMLAGARELDRHGIGAAALKLPLHLFGVYDGHGGSEVANYCANRMHVVLKEALGRAARAGLEESGELLDITELWQKVFGGCFQRVDDEVSGQASRLCGGVSSEAQCKPVAAGDVGSTAAVAVVCSSHIIVANCGDSRVVLSRGKEPVPLSDDHKPDREDERARIEAAGGRVIDWNGHRVSGVLAMSRSIGDGYGTFLIPTPEVKVIPRARDDDCLIIATDGLWDVISNAEACKVARVQILQWHRKNNGVCSDEGGVPTISHPAAQAAANYLLKLALLKGSADNITVTVIDLKLRKKIKDKSICFV